MADSLDETASGRNPPAADILKEQQADMDREEFRRYIESRRKPPDDVWADVTEEDIERFLADDDLPETLEHVEATSPVGADDLPTTMETWAAGVRDVVDHLERWHIHDVPDEVRLVNAADLSADQIDRLLSDGETCPGTDILTNSDPTLPAPAPSPARVLNDNLTSSKPRKNFGRDTETLENVRLSAWPDRPELPAASIYGGACSPYPLFSDHIRTHTIPPEWRDITPQHLASLLHQVVINSGAGFGFAVTVSDQIEEKARANPRGQLHFIAQKVARDFKRVTGAVPDWWAALDEGEQKGRLHIQGGVVVPGGSEEALKAIMRNLPGEDGNPAEVVVLPKTDLGWAWYSTRNLGSGATDDNGLLHVSRSLAARTKEAYESWRALRGRGARGARWE